MPQTPNFTRLAFFGDSLSDNGQTFNLTSSVLQIPVPLAAAGYAGVFSDGPVFADVSPSLLGISDVENYAIGGARAVGSRTLQEYITANGLDALLLPNADPLTLALDTNLGGQVQRYLASGATAAEAADTAASLFIGVNDFNNFVPTNPLDPLPEALALINNMVSQTLAAAATLAGAGVGTIILSTLPDGTFFPTSAGDDPATQAFTSLAADTFNAALVQGGQQLEASTGTEVLVIDFAAMADEIVSDPSAFGFVAPLTLFTALGAGFTIVDTPTGPVINVTTDPLAGTFDPDQIAFFDAVHPSEALHGVLGSFHAASLTHDDVVFLGDGAQSVKTSTGSDMVFGGTGDDTIDLGSGSDIAFGGQDDDTINGGRGQDILAGGSGNDTLQGGRGADVIAGGDGDDTLYGRLGADVIFDGLGSDTAYGGRGDDIFVYVDPSMIGGTTGADNDHFDGEGGNDTLYLLLSDSTYASIGDQVAAGNLAYLGLIGLSIDNIENVVLVDTREDLDSITTTARLDEADLWGLI